MKRILILRANVNTKALIEEFTKYSKENDIILLSRLQRFRIFNSRRNI
ncbi:hypothetical protein [Brachyspira hampsonii]|nr:hypothetical protein [Brachyspira hampsonii]